MRTTSRGRRTAAVVAGRRAAWIAVAVALTSLGACGNLFPSTSTGADGGTGGDGSGSNDPYLRHIPLQAGVEPNGSATPYNPGAPSVAATGSACTDPGYPVGCGAACCPAGVTCVAGACLVANVPASCPVACGTGCCAAGAACSGTICTEPPPPIACGTAFPVNCGAWCCSAGQTCDTTTNSCLSVPDAASCASDAGTVQCGSGTCCPSGTTCNAGDQCASGAPLFCGQALAGGGGGGGGKRGTPCAGGCCVSDTDTCSAGQCTHVAAPPVCTSAGTYCTGTDYCAPAGVACSACNATTGCSVGQGATLPPGDVVACAGGGCPSADPACASSDADPAGVCCPAGLGLLCGTTCCPVDTCGAPGGICATGTGMGTCNGNQCGCPSLSPAPDGGTGAPGPRCGTDCCTTGQSCVNGTCVDTCSGGDVQCGTDCCNPLVVCAADTCVCPPGHPTQCGDYCCQAGAPCINNGQDCGCPPGQEQCNTTAGCCPVASGGSSSGGGSCSDPNTVSMHCPSGPDQCCSPNMLCCHDSANGGAIGCEFSGFCE